MAETSVNETLTQGIKKLLNFESGKDVEQSKVSAEPTPTVTHTSGKKEYLPSALYQHPHSRDRYARDSPISEDQSVLSYAATPLKPQHQQVGHVEGRNMNRQSPGGPPESPATKRIQPKKKKKRKKTEKPGAGEEATDGNTSIQNDNPTSDSGKSDNVRKQKSKQQIPDQLMKKGKLNENTVDSSQDVEVVDGFVQCQNGLFKKELVDQYEKEYIFLLKKKSLKFPTAKFFCRLCDYHCFDWDHCEKHTKDTRHKRLKKVREQDQLLRNLPAPGPAHIEHLTELIDQVYEAQGLTDTDFMLRQDVVKNVEKLIKDIDPEVVQLVMYGSSDSMLGLKSSDVNMDFTTDVPPRFLKDAHIELKDNEKSESGYVAQVESDFSAKVPCVRFNVPSAGVRCQLGINNTGSHRTSGLLRTYSKIDPRFTKLEVAFRYLGRLCKYDSQAEGTLPAYVLSLMTTFFLQQCKPPVLPVLHEIAKPDSKDPAMENYYFKDLDKLGDHWKCENNSSVGELWVKMLRFYSIDFDFNVHVISLRQLRLLNRQEKKWASKKLAIEDPFVRRRNVARSVSHTQVFEYISERIRAAYQYFGIPQTKDGPLFHDLNSLKCHLRAQKGLRTKECDNIREDTVKIGGDKLPGCSSSKPIKQTQEENLVDTANISVPDVESDETTVKCANSAALAASPSEKTGQSSTDEKSVHDVVQEIPEETEVNSVTDQEKEDWLAVFARGIVENIFEKTFELLSGERTLVDCESATENKGTNKGTNSVHADNLTLNDTTDVGDAHEAATPEASETSLKETAQIDTDFELNSPINESLHEESTTVVESPSVDQSADRTEEDCTTDGSKSLSETVSPTLDLFSFETPENLHFRFDEKTLSDAKGPAVMCGICQQEGHLKTVCPEENLSPPAPLPPLTRAYRDTLNKLIHRVPSDFEPTRRELDMRQNVVYELEQAIRESFPDAKLQLFGSSCNGFGFRGSDLDLCLTFEDEMEPEMIDSVQVIEHLAKVMKKQRSLYQVFAITTAKVPIVKFKHRRSQLEGDISLYNTLAIENTRMLLMYAEMDSRVKHLGYTMKVFAKICDICDASRGSLSSYAYILLVLYYLQQRQPPVIPVLQELYPMNGEKGENLIDNWNAWFYDDMSKIKQMWPDYGKNKETLADLWIGLLRFYTEDFNVKDYVVSIRQKAPLTKFEKLWNNRTIAIEDPFDLGHNLGGGLSRKMNMFLIRTLRNARTIFGTSITSIPNGYKSLQDYLFDPNILTDSSPPSDRNCHRCGKIGHFVKECPMVDGRKDGRLDQSMEQEPSPQYGSPHKGGRPNDPRNHGTPDPRTRSTPERSKSAPQAIPQVRHHDRQMSNSPDYSRSQHHDYQRSRSTPDAIAPLMVMNQHYNSSPGNHSNRQQYQQQGVYVTTPSGAFIHGSPQQKRPLLPDPQNAPYQTQVGGSPTGQYQYGFNSPRAQYQQAHVGSPSAAQPHNMSGSPRLQQGAYGSSPIMYNLSDVMNRKPGSPQQHGNYGPQHNPSHRSNNQHSNQQNYSSNQPNIQGNQQYHSSYHSNFHGNQQNHPGNQSHVHSNQQNHLGNQHNFQGNQQNRPGNQANFPGNQQNQPNNQPNVHGNQRGSQQQPTQSATRGIPMHSLNTQQLNRNVMSQPQNTNQTVVDHSARQRSGKQSVAQQLTATVQKNSSPQKNSRKQGPKRQYNSTEYSPNSSNNRGYSHGPAAGSPGYNNNEASGAEGGAQRGGTQWRSHRGSRRPGRGTHR